MTVMYRFPAFAEWCK